MIFYCTISRVKTLDFSALTFSYCLHSLDLSPKWLNFRQGVFRPFRRKSSTKRGFETFIKGFASPNVVTSGINFAKSRLNILKSVNIDYIKDRQVRTLLILAPKTVQSLPTTLRMYAGIYRL